MLKAFSLGFPSEDFQSFENQRSGLRGRDNPRRTRSAADGSASSRHYRSGRFALGNPSALGRLGFARAMARITPTRRFAPRAIHDDAPSAPRARRIVALSARAVFTRPCRSGRLRRGRLYSLVGMNFCYMRILLIGPLALDNDLSTLAMRPSSNRYHPFSNSQIAPVATLPKITPNLIMIIHHLMDVDNK